MPRPQTLSPPRAGQASESLLQKAKEGDAQCLGGLLESHRGYLALLAKARFDQQLQGRLSISDVVQETMLDAYRDFGKFAGAEMAEFRGWIRRVLIHNMGTAIENHVLAAKRDVRRQVSIRKQVDQSVNQSAAAIEAMLVAPEISAAGDVCRKEQLTQLADVIGSLPEDQRLVIMLRNIEGLSFGEVAKRMGRSSAATRMLWLRALSKLRKLMAGEDS